VGLDGRRRRANLGAAREKGKRIYWHESLVRLARPDVEILATVEISTGSLDLCSALIQEPLNRKPLQFNYIAGFAISIRFWHCACSKAVKPNKGNDEQDQLHLSENTMRSELVFTAMTHVSNRFLLSMVAARAARKLHRPNTRIQETVNDVLVRLRHEDPIARVSNTGNAQPFSRAA
jgi:hypothetical protein